MDMFRRIHTCVYYIYIYMILCIYIYHIISIFEYHVHIYNIILCIYYICDTYVILATNDGLMPISQHGQFTNF